MVGCPERGDRIVKLGASNLECDASFVGQLDAFPSANHPAAQQPALKGRFIIAQGEALGRTTYNHIRPFPVRGPHGGRERQRQPNKMIDAYTFND